MITPRARGTALTAFALIPLAVVACDDLALEPSQVPTTLSLEPVDLFLEEGIPGKIRVVVLDQDGREMPSPPTWAPPRWNIGEPGALTIYPDGTIEGHRGGFITAIALTAGKSARATVSVQPDAVALSARALYLNQAAQNVDGEVPTIAGRAAFLRAFVTGDEGSFYRPTVRADLFLNDVEVHTVTMAPGDDYLPERPEEGRLDRSYNAVIPAEFIQPGLEVVLDMDVNGDVPLKPNSSTRWPPEGRVEMNVIDFPLMRLTVVPTLLSLAPEEDGALRWVQGLNPTSDRTRLTRTLLPIGDFEITIHEPYTTDADLTSGNGWNRYLREITTLREIEGEVGYYYGAVDLPPGSAYGGLGWVGFPASVGRTTDATMAHELGHNMNLYHAPCGGAAGPDPQYPHEDGDIGIWGYDVERTRLHPPREFKDLMGYCGPDWVSDYHFNRAMNFRLGTGLDIEQSTGPSGTRLLVSGAVGPNGIVLDPSFVVEARALVPNDTGPYRLYGFDSDGRTLFAHAFSPIEEGFGSRGFVFTLPYDPSWEGRLDRIQVSGPEGEGSLAHGSAPQAAIVRDPDSGQVLAIIHDLERRTYPVAGSYTLSDGLPISSNEPIR